MKPVMQTEFYPPKGDCFSACLASLLECPIEDLPKITSQEAGVWFEPFIPWLAERNACAVEHDIRENGWRPAGYAIGTIKSPRGDWNHAVVIHVDRIVHDPHPAGGSEGAKLLFAMILYPLDPAKPIKTGRLLAGVEHNNFPEAP